jgi:ketosteroid isomerase-like protein
MTLRPLIPKCVLFLLFSCIVIFSVQAQTDEKQIRAIRKASNDALYAFNYEQALSFLTDDVLITTGNGMLINGKAALKKYLDSNRSDEYWVRTPKEITVNTKRGLAWETGTWQNYDGYSNSRGNYSAMWTISSGTWKIKSQLFINMN